MLSWSRISAFLITATTALLLTWLWSVWQPASFTAEVTLASSAHACSKVYFDQGRGLSEADSSAYWIPGCNVPVACRFHLPEGTYYALRFDPIDCSGTATFSSMRIVGPGGAVIRTFAPEDFIPRHQISEHTVSHGMVRMVTEPGVNDPYYFVALPKPLLLRDSPAQSRMRTATRFAISFLLTLGVAALGRFVWRRHSLGFAAARDRVSRHPHVFLGLLAAAAAVAASYPVVFCGRSNVSPNNSSTLLYGAVPTIPGLEDQRQADGRNRDLGAMMFAHLPYTIVENRALFRDHELPLWDRYNSCGVPLLGQGQSMFGDPLQLPVLLAGGAAWAFDFKFVLAKALFAAGLGFTVWAATRNLSAAALVTFAAAFVGFFNFRLNHPAIFSVGVAPWVLLCWVHLVQSATLRKAGGWCLGLMLANGSLLTSGTVKEAYMLLLSLNLAGGLALLFSPDTFAAKWRKGALAAGAGLVLLLLSAPVWLTFLDTLRSAYTSSDQPEAWQFPPNWVIGLFDDLFYRELSVEHNVVAPSLNFFLLLGVLWFCSCFRRFWRDSLAMILAAGALGAISLAFTWVPGSLIVRLPLLRNVMHIGNTFSCVAMIYLTVLAGYGFHGAQEVLMRKNGWWSALFTLVLLAALLLACFHPMAEYWSGHPGLRQWLLIVPAHRPFFILLAILLAAAVTLTLVAAWSFRQKRLSALAGFIALLALGILLVRQGQHYSTAFGETYFTAPAVRTDLQAPSPALEFMKAAAGQEPFRVVGFDDNLIPGWNGVYGLEGIAGPDALMNPWYRELVAACGLDRGGGWRIIVHLETLAAFKPAYDFLNVRYYCDLHSDPAQLGAILRPVALADLNLYRSKTTWPRAFFTDGVLTYATPQQLAALIKDNPGHPFAAVQAGDNQASPPALPDPAARLIVPAVDYRLTTNATSFQVAVPKAGVIVLQETWLPKSFRVTVNGRPAEYFRVNHAFKGVTVPSAGTYRVTFTYRPRYWTLALTLAGLGLALLAAGIAGFRVIEKRGGLPVLTRT